MNTRRDHQLNQKGESNVHKLVKSVSTVEKGVLGGIKKKRWHTSKQKLHGFTSKCKFVTMYWKRTWLFFKFMPRNISSLYKTLSRMKTLIFLQLFWDKTYWGQEDTCHCLAVTTSGFIVLHAHFSWNLPSPNRAQVEEIIKGHLTTLISN